MKNYLTLFTIIFILLLPLTTYGSGEKLEILLNNVYDNYDIPETSGPVTNLPWRNNKRFLQAKSTHNTPFLMAGFCAVLKDPLPGEEYNVKLAANNIKEIIIKPGETFSQNSAIGPYTKSNGYKDGASYAAGSIVMTEGGGVCKIATTLYNLAVLSDLDIVERYNHSMPINYVPYGQDATVAYGIKDFKFKNDEDTNILIWSQMIDNRLYIAFYSNIQPPKVQWHHEFTSSTKPPIKYIKNTDLKPGQMVTIANGMEGATVKSTVTVTKQDGSVSIKNMGTSHYSPLPKVIEIH